MPSSSGGATIALRGGREAGRRGQAVATPTTLLNEAWLKLSGSARLGAASEMHFKCIAVRAMRQVLIDAARKRKATKRGGVVITIDDAHAVTADPSDRVLALDAALTRLAVVNARQAQMVEARYFGGFDVAETAELLGVSEATVMRDWRMARAWLAVELRAEGVEL